MSEKGTTVRVPFMMRLVCEALVDGEDESTIVAMHVRDADVGIPIDAHPSVREFVAKRGTDLTAMALRTAVNNAAENIAAKGVNDVPRIVIPD